MAAPFIVSSLLLTHITADVSTDCSIRHRKPWHSLSDDERALFVSGFQALRDTNVLETFVLTHRPSQTGGYNPHITSENLYWHSYYLYEIETQIRALGPEYECFSMPYWDITNDGEYWVNERFPTAEGMPLYNSMLGGEGDSENNYCVVDAPWALPEYTTDYLCADNEEEGKCCLKRASGAWSDDTRLFTRAEVAEPVVTNKDYKDFNEFGLKITDIHVNVHNFIGHENLTHFNTYHGRPPADPLFVLFHTFLDYVRVLHQDCYDFDKLGVHHLEREFPYSYKVMFTDLDYVMRFGVLCDAEDEGLDVIVSPMCEETNITVRDIYDSSINTKWNVLYELGDFWNLNPDLLAECADNVNMTWFSNEGIDEKSATAEAVESYSGIVNGGKMAARFGLRQYVLWMMIILSAVTAAVVGVCLMARCVRNRHKRMDIMDLFINEYVAV